LALAFVLCLPFSQLQAAPDLYQGNAPVADQSAAEQERAMRAALEQVLQKLSGLSQFEEYPEMPVALESARNMVLAFYYQDHPVFLPDGSSRMDKLLVANFSPRAVDELRVRLQLPRWKPERRALSAWPIVDDGLERRIMPIELEYAWAGMAGLAENRGMPITWPEAGEDGEYAADVQLLWGGYTEELNEEGLAETLVIAARQDGPEWNVRMNLEYEGLRWSERFRGIDLVTILQQGLNQAIDQIATSSSIAASELGDWSVDITVTQVTGSEDYARCLGYLQGLSLVEAVTVKSAAAGAVQFSLALNAAPEHLQQYLDAGDMLLISGEEGVYQLQP
jgi:hypothetical protein